jgi:hypothetical protein
MRLKRATFGVSPSSLGDGVMAKVVTCPASGEAKAVPRCGSCGDRAPTGAIDQVRNRALSDRDPEAGQAQ